MITKEELIVRIKNACAAVIGAEAELTEIDSRFGDADHGFTMTKIANTIPSAKMMGLNGAVFYMSYLPAETLKVKAIRKSIHPTKTETLAEYYNRINGHLLSGIRILEIDDDGAMRWIR